MTAVNGKTISFGPEWKPALISTERTGTKHVYYTLKSSNGKKFPDRIMIREEIAFDNAETLEAMKAISRAYRTLYNPRLSFAAKRSSSSYGSYDSYDAYDSTSLEITGWLDASSKEYWIEKITQFLS